mmetsp:Transcript_50005/g.99592  ORF Transcript_50005/g.99592 Transcript_50005/m.99592 type:complete len:319 (-) Transcript_50005:333-1289(-)
MPASTQTALSCAPLKSSVQRPSSSKLTMSFTFILRLCICMMRARPSSVGSGNSILRSMRPERSRAGSRMSTRLVAAMTLIASVEEKPSSWLSSSSIVRCTSRSPESSESKRFVPTASSSSMKIIAGCFSLARANASRTSFAPSPINIWTSCGPASFRKHACVRAAHARAMSVLPVPGGPYMSAPFGGLMPMLSKRSLCVMGSTTASISSSICVSRPPTSLNSSVGFSSTSIALTRESNSEGSASRIRYESLLTPTRSAGLSFSGSTRPGTGRKMVCRVEVLSTQQVPLRCASKSMLAPSSSGSSSSSMSSSSTTLATR